MSRHTNRVHPRIIDAVLTRGAAPLCAALLACVLVALLLGCSTGSAEQGAPQGNGDTTAAQSPTEAPGSQQATEPAPVHKPDTEYQLVFADEFEGNSLDTHKWNPEMRWGKYTRKQLQHYEPQAATVRGGTLRLTATRSPAHGFPYQSGAIASFGRFDTKYGYAEMRAKVPRGRGLWPAFWLTSDDPSVDSEIDVMEVLGQDPRRVHMWLHTGKARSKDEPHGSYRGSDDYSAGFHTFGVEWTPEAVVWYVDKIERFRVDNSVPGVPMYLVANLAVGSDAAWGGAPNAATRFPAVYEIDYIRAYQRK